MERVLIVTNDFPPRDGGIERYVFEYARRLGDVVVLTSATSEVTEGVACDELPFPVVRTGDKVLLPTPSVGRRAVDLTTRLRASLAS